MSIEACLLAEAMNYGRHMDAEVKRLEKRLADFRQEITSLRQRIHAAGLALDGGKTDPVPQCMSEAPGREEFSAAMGLTGNVRRPKGQDESPGPHDLGSRFEGER